MLDLITQFITTVSNIISFVFGLVSGFFQFIFNLCTLLVEGIFFVLDLFWWIPEELLGLILSLFVLVVLFRLLGREG